MAHALETSSSGDWLQIAQPQLTTKRQRAQVERGQHHFTVPPYKMGQQPMLRCWCGATVAMNSPHVTTFAKEHGECAMGEQE